MKNRIKYIVVLAFAFSFLFAATAYADKAKPEVSSMAAEATTEMISVSGTMDSKGAVAVVVQVLDEDQIIGMESFLTDEASSFGGNLYGLILAVGKTYTVRAANYDGGAWFTTTVTVPNDPVPTSSGHRYVEGWVQDSIGWWYRRSNGSWPANCWAELPWGGKKEWYHFDSRGYMQTGWFTDVDGRVYYLWPVSDNSMGRMLYGSQIIGGVPYNFNTIHDGYFGALVK